MRTPCKRPKPLAKARRKEKRTPRSSNPSTQRKCRFGPEELEEFRQTLLNKRMELIGDTASLLTETVRENGRSSGMPLHMAELASDTWEQEMTFGLIKNKQSLLREIEEAIARIEDGTYGICEATKKKITKARLRAIPWARHCIEYALRHEAGLV